MPLVFTHPRPLLEFMVKALPSAINVPSPEVVIDRFPAGKVEGNNRLSCMPMRLWHSQHKGHRKWDDHCLHLDATKASTGFCGERSAGSSSHFFEVKSLGYDIVMTRLTLS